MSLREVAGDAEGIAEAEAELHDRERELEQATAGWTSHLIARSYAQNEGGLDDFADDAMLLEAKGYFCPDGPDDRGMATFTYAAPAWYPESLAANRAGSLSETQRQSLQTEVGFGVFVVAAGVTVGIGLVVVGLLGPATMTAFMAGCLELGAVAVFYSLWPAHDAWLDLRAAGVEAETGPVSKVGLQARAGRSATRYGVLVGADRVWMTRTMFEAAPDAGMIRAYVLPRTRRLVNFESSSFRSPSAPAPAMAAPPTTAALAPTPAVPGPASAPSSDAAVIAGILELSPAGISRAALLAWARLRSSPDFTEQQLDAALAEPGPAVTVVDDYVRRT